MKAPFGMALAVVALAPLLGCSIFEKSNPAPCPRIVVLGDAAKMTRFRSGPGRDLTDVELMAEVGSFSGSCQYDMDSRTMNLTLQMGIDADLGPAAKSRTAGLSYFVAMPVFYPKPQAKQVLPVTLTFPDNVNHVRFIDNEVTVSFPISDFKKLDRYKVFVGLQLDEAQLDYNRENQHRQ